MVERLPNYDKFEELYNFYTTEGGLNPMQASGMLGNIYAESRGNPQAINPQDGSDGSDSRGIIQWNGSRDSALRNFASQRGEVADGLLTQARFSIFEGTQGSERNNFQGAIQGDSAGQIALQLAQKYIRPAAQHIPQREAYGDMMYDIFANGNPNGVAAGLSFSPQQGEDLSRASGATEQGANLSFGDDMPAMDERTGQPVGQKPNFDPSSISAKLMELANPRTVNGFDDPTPPMGGPRVAMAEALDPQTGSPNVGQMDNPLATTRERPRMQQDGATSGGPRGEYGGDGNEPNPEDSINAEIDAQLPTGEGQTNASTIINEDYVPAIAEEAALSMGVPVDEAPRSVAEVARAASEPAPDPEDTSEEAEKKRAKRLLAADMLETLSVGLGQMGAGQAVSLGDVIQGQAQRRAGRAELEREAAAQQQAAQQQQQQMQTVAQQFTNMGMGGMAQLAMSGPEGLAEAMSTLGTINGRAPTASSVMERMSPAQRREAMIAAGVPADAAASVEQFPDLSQEMLKTYAMPDPDAAAAEAERAGVNNEINSLASIGSNYSDNAAVRAAATSAFANPNQANATAFRNALAEAGATEAELAAAQAEAQQEAPLPLSEGEAMFYGRRFTPEEIALAQQDPALAEQIRNAGGEALEKGAIAAAQQDVAQNVPPERIRFLEELARNETAMRTELRLKATEAGTDGFNDIETIMATNLLDANQTKVNNLTTREPMVSAMRDLVTLLSDPNVDRSEGGPLTAALTGLTNIGSQLGITMGPQEDIENYMARVMESYTGEFFQNFRLEGSGATSDMEAKNYMNAMPNIRDNNLKRLGLAQRIIRMNERDTLATQLEQDWVARHSEDPEMLLNSRARAEFIRDGVASEAKELYPVVDRSSDTWIDDVEASVASGNIAPETVIRYTSPDGEAKYVMFGDLAKELGLEL